MGLKKKAKGQFFTPKPLVQAILKRVIDQFPYDYQSRPITVLDPAIGKGIFFISLIPMISSFVSDVKLFGIDIDPSLLKIAKKELIQLAKSTSYEVKLKQGDFFLNFPSVLPTKFDIIIGNPPHNALYSQLEWTQIRKKCQFGQNSLIYSESSIFFTLHSLSLLKPGGILCFLLPKPIIYSKRWTEFRKILLTDFYLVEVLDLGNQFTGQLQEQCAIIAKKENSDIRPQEYQTGIWNSTGNDFDQISIVSSFDALMVDNLLVGVSTPELEIIRRLYSDEYQFLDLAVFRGMSSKFRTKKGTIPLIEKATISTGFLFPARSFLHERTPIEKLNRQQIPKIIAQRIISYQTKPKFNLNIKTWVDQEGVMLTHETVINIISNYSQDILSLFAVAGLLESSLTAWWLQHAVYSKEFVTSKDFDKAYVNSIRIPRINGSKTPNLRKKLARLLETKNFEEIVKQLRFRPVIEIFHTLGETYSKYQCVGAKFKDLLNLIIEEDEFFQFNQKRTDFQNFKKLYQNLTLEFQNSKATSLQNDQYMELMAKFNELKVLHTFMDDLVFLIYNITPIERKIIESNFASRI